LSLVVSSGLAEPVWAATSCIRGKMKPDERKLAVLLLNRGKVQPDTIDGESTRTLVRESGLNYKRACYLLSKWTGKGWYEYGTSLELGWVTEDGAREFAKLTEA